ERPYAVTLKLVEPRLGVPPDPTGETWCGLRPRARPGLFELEKETTCPTHTLPAVSSSPVPPPRWARSRSVVTLTPRGPSPPRCIPEPGKRPSAPTCCPPSRRRT